MRIWPRSLTGRILLAEGAAISLAALLLPVLMISMLHRTTRTYQGRVLTAQATRIAAGVHVVDGHVRVTLPADLAALYGGRYAGLAYAVVDERAAPVAGDASLARVLVRRARDAALLRLPRFVSEGVPVRAGDRRLTVVVGQDEARPDAVLDDIARAFLWRYAAVLVAVLLLLPLLNSLAVRWLVRGIRHASALSEAIGPATPEGRLDAARLPAEVQPLVGATNRLLSRLHQALADQRAFVGNIAHELRTPLAAAKAQVDALARTPTRDALDRSLDRVSHIVAQLHDLAALELVEARAPVPFDLTQVAGEVVAELAPAIIAGGRSIGLDAPAEPVIAAGEPALIRLALDNLVRNAGQHTPPGTAITVAVAADALSVVDNGPGVHADADDLTRRFWRAGQMRSDAAGLGLAIVRRIAEAHGGTLSVGAAPGGGALFIVTLPPVAHGAPPP